MLIKILTISVSEKSLKEVNHATNTKSRDSEGTVLLTRGSVSDHDSDGKYFVTNNALRLQSVL